MNSALQYILGAIEDGCICMNERKRDYRLIIIQKNREWLEKSLQPRFKEQFNIQPIIRKRKDELWELRVYSKEIVLILNNYIKHLDFLDLNIHYVAGFYDAEGDKTLRRIRIWCKDARKLNKIAKILSQYGIKYSMYLDDKKHKVYCLEVSSKYKPKFLKLIPLEHPKVLAHTSSPPRVPARMNGSTRSPLSRPGAR